MGKAGPSCLPIVSIHGKSMTYSGERAGGPGTQGQRPGVAERVEWTEIRQLAVFNKRCASESPRRSKLGHWVSLWTGH